MVVGVPKPALDVQGTLQTFTGRGDSGKPTYRRFCPECGSTLIDEAEALPNVTMILAGTLDDASWLKPDHGDLLRQRAALGEPRRRAAALPEDAGTVISVIGPKRRAG